MRFGVQDQGGALVHASASERGAPYLTLAGSHSRGRRHGPGGAGTALVFQQAHHAQQHLCGLAARGQIKLREIDGPHLIRAVLAKTIALEKAA